MTKKEYCTVNPVCAYYSGYTGIEIHGVEHEGVETYVYCVSGILGGGKSYHRVKVHYAAHDNDYFRVGWCRVPLAECILV